MFVYFSVPSIYGLSRIHIRANTTLTFVNAIFCHTNLFQLFFEFFFQLLSWGFKETKMFPYVSVWLYKTYVKYNSHNINFYCNCTLSEYKKKLALEVLQSILYAQCVFQWLCSRASKCYQTVKFVFEICLIPIRLIIH